MSEVASEGMTFDQAAQELQNSGAEQAAADAAVGPGNPELQQTPSPTPGEEVAPEEQTPFTSEDVPEDSFTGSDFNPDLLPPELQDGWKSLQGDYTRKTQELAEQRKTLEALGSPEELQQAQEFFQSLQDPDYLKAFHTELGNVVRELGLEDPEAPVAPEVVAPEPVELPPELANISQTDPELAPLVEQFTSMKQRLDQFEAQQTEREQAMAEERDLMTQAAEIDRMVQVVRADHPTYGEEDWQAIYDRAVALDGNVLQAAELYEKDTNRIIEGYLAQKPVPHAVTPTSGGGVVTEDEPTELSTLDQAQEAAEAYLNANDLQEFGG